MLAVAFSQRSCWARTWWQSSEQGPYLLPPTLNISLASCYQPVMLSLIVNLGKARIREPPHEDVCQVVLSAWTEVARTTLIVDCTFWGAAQINENEKGKYFCCLFFLRFLYTHVCAGAYGVQWRASDPLEAEWQATVSLSLVMEMRFKF